MPRFASFGRTLQAVGIKIGIWVGIRASVVETNRARGRRRSGTLRNGGASLPTGIQAGANVLVLVWPVEGGHLTAVGSRGTWRKGRVAASAAETGPRTRRENRVLQQWRTPLLRHVLRQLLALLSLHGGRRARTDTTQGGGEDVQRAFVLLLVR